MNALIEDIRKNTLEETSPEMANWAKEYTPEMGKLQTKFMISKKHKREVTIKDVTYEKLFPKQGINRKVLLKACHGLGKSTCCKKIAWDWATGKFTSVSVVFHLTMKTLKAGDNIESIIVEQYREKGVEINRQALYDIFRERDYETLVIINGVDETLSRANNLEILVANYPLTSFSLLLTVGPEVSIEIEKIFPTICEIQDISQNDIRCLVSSFMKGDQSRTDMVLNSEISIPPQLGTSWSLNPMLLMFLSFLVDRESFDLVHEGTRVSIIKKFRV